MSPVFIIFIILVLLLLCIWIFWENWPWSGTPPGPFRFPVLGTLPQIVFADKVTYLALHKMSKKYGDVMSVKLGLLDTVIVSSFKAAKEILNRDEVLGRPCEGVWLDRCMEQNIGLIFSNGKSWEEIRKFSRDTLRKYGFGNRGAMEQLILEEIQHLLTSIEKDRAANYGRIHVSVDYFNISFVNLMSSMVTGKISSYNDPQLLKLLKHSNNFVKNGVLGTGILTAYPYLRFILPGLLGYNIQMRSVRGIQKYAKKMLRIRRETDYSENPQCFTDEFLKKMDEDAGSSNPLFTKDQFLVLFSDLMQSGSETTSNSISYTLLQLTCNLVVQEKMYNEIVQICGTEQSPGLNDKTRMVYTQAVILEGYRLARTVVLGAPRKVIKDFDYKNYKLQAGTVILTNTHTIFFDEEFWGDPEAFRPERFLDGNNCLIHSKADRISIAFGVGKRNCFGEVMARDSSFLFLTALIQKFAFKRPKDQQQPCLEPMPGISLGPYPYDMMVKVRIPDLA